MSFNHERFSTTPRPHTCQPSDRWRETGSHRVADGSCCHCGPANHMTGPQYVCHCPRGREQ